MVERKQNQYDKLLIGWLIGTIVPLVFFLIVFMVKYSQLDFIVFVKNMWQMKIFLKLLSLCVFPNLGIFMIYLNRKFDNAARGIILATFMYAFLVLIAKLI